MVSTDSTASANGNDGHPDCLLGLPCHHSSRGRRIKLGGSLGFPHGLCVWEWGFGTSLHPPESETLGSHWPLLAQVWGWALLFSMVFDWFKAIKLLLSKSFVLLGCSFPGPLAKESCLCCYYCRPTFVGVCDSSFSSQAETQEVKSQARKFPPFSSGGLELPGSFALCPPFRGSHVCSI